MELPRIMLAAPASGSGKTLLVCGLLKALKNRGLASASFKCGPDYIDPMFHQQALGIAARNLDTFFTDPPTTRYLFGRAAAQAGISILEGVMGYYDGAGGDTVRASSYELACATDSPVLLVVNAKGMSLSLIPLIQGFLRYRKNSRIAGVIFNQISPALFERIAGRVEEEAAVPVFGYVPKCPEFVIDSRHLGLVMPHEVEQIQNKLQSLSQLLEKTLDIDGIVACARQAPRLDCSKPQHIVNLQKQTGRQGSGTLPETAKASEGEREKCVREDRLRIGIARDEAFCFYYQDNLELLQELGAEIIYFSPLWDKKLPRRLDGLILYGGYPELYAETLSCNKSMRDSVKESIERGMPYLAECGGFLYLQQSLEDMKGKNHPMAGVFSGKAFRTSRLRRFGYLSLSASDEGQLLTRGEKIKGHEYHYYDCTENGQAYHGRKPYGGNGWDCMQGGGHFAAGFPHLYYYSNPEFVKNFLQACREYRQRQIKSKIAACAIHKEGFVELPFDNRIL